MAKTPLSTGQRLMLGIPVLGAVTTTVVMVYAGTSGSGMSSADKVVTALFFIAWGIAPYAGLLISMIVVARRAPRAWPMLVVASVPFTAFGIFAVISVVLSDSSTAAIGFVFIPPMLWLCLGVLMLAVVIVHLALSRYLPERAEG